MKIPQWLSTVLEAQRSRSLDDYVDCAALALAIVEARANVCRLCDQDLTGKHNRTHYTDAKEQTPCKGSWL